MANLGMDGNSVMKKMNNIITLWMFAATFFIVSCSDSTEDVKSTAGGKSLKVSIVNHGDDTAEIREYFFIDTYLISLDFRGKQAIQTFFII